MANEEDKNTDIPLADDESVPSVLQNSARRPKPAQPLPKDTDEDQEERARCITQVLELQNTLQDLNQRVDVVKEERLKLMSENQVLGQYIENLVSSSNLFYPANSKMHVSTNKFDDFQDF